MESNIKEPQESEDYLKTQMQGIPHFKDLDIPGLTQARLLGLLDDLKEEVDEDDVCPEETVFKLNFKSWVYIKLGDHVKAEEINDRVLDLTRWENVMAVGNCAFLNWRYGRQKKALRCVSKLHAMKGLQNFQERIDTARAELAYCYSRVGGHVNMNEAIRLFEEVVGNNADKIHWKLRLGLAYRQCTNFNFYTGIPEGRTVLECVENAAKHLTDVYKDSSAGKLRGPALSELALCQSALYYNQRNNMNRIFGKQNSEEMCNEAWKRGVSSTWVLTNCGKIFQNLKQLDRAVEALEDSLRVRNDNMTHLQLGLCYAAKAQHESKPQTSWREQEPGREVSRGRGGQFYSGRGQSFSGRGQSYPDRGQSYHGRGQSYACRGQSYSGRGAHSYSEREEQSFYDRQSDYRYPSASEPVITLPNENYNRAEREYLEAIKLSYDRNLRAVYDLGLLYRLAGNYQDAVERFNQVTNSEGGGYLATLINAYEQAGLCYQKMDKPEAEDKLTKAISLAVMVASTCPQMKNSATEIWQSLRAIRDGPETESPSLSRDKKLMQLYKLVKKYKGDVKVVEEVIALSDSQLKDPAIITAGLRGYLQQQETEKAFVFLNMVSIGSNMTNTWGTSEMIDLRREVLLRTAENRLKLHSNDAKCVVQELFKLQYGQCAGCVSGESVDIPNNRDVLLFYDDDHDTEELSQISQTVHDLQAVLSQVFGLDVSRNLQGCLKYGPKNTRQLEEMAKHQVVVVILGEESRSAEFKALMEKIPHMTTTVDPSKKVVVTDACRQETEIPHMTTTVDPSKKVVVIDACQQETEIPHMTTTVDPSKKVVVIDAYQQETEIPESLRHYPCFRLRHQAVGKWGQNETGAPRREGHIPVRKLTRRIVGDNLMSLMPLFKFVVGLPLH